MSAFPSFAKFSPFVLKLQAIIWLIVALALLTLTVVLWMYSKNVTPKDSFAPNSVEKSVASIESVNISEHIDKLDDLNADVAPLEFKTIVRDLRHYPKEFKDKIYIDKRKGKWTVQVMDVSKHEIITDYLNNREDRQKFAYFRFSDQDNQPRYMLIYGEVNGFEEAMALANDIDFALPASVNVIPEEMNRYASMIDNYERGGEVLDMSRNRPRAIRLQKTRYLVPVKRVVKKPPPTKIMETSTNQMVNATLGNGKVVHQSLGQPSSNVNTQHFGGVNRPHGQRNPMNNNARRLVANQAPQQQQVAIPQRADQSRASSGGQSMAINQNQSNHVNKPNTNIDVSGHGAQTSIHNNNSNNNSSNRPNNNPNGNDGANRVKPFIPNSPPN